MKNFLKTGLAALLVAHVAGALAQGFALEGAVIDSRSGNSLGVVSERGDLSALFRAQKSMTFGILRSAGISLEQLSPEVRARIERFQTTNVEAFRAFSQGLDLKDQGKFAEARESFKRAAELDPGFALASDQQQSMPDVNVSSSLQMRAVMQTAAAAAVDKGKATFVLDLARALAALQAGQTVVTVASAADPGRRDAADAYTSNQPGSEGSSSGGSNRLVALAYSVGNPASPDGRISVAELRPENARATGGVLEEVRSGNAQLASRGSATVSAQDNSRLSDGTVAYWGRWDTASGNASVVDAGQARTAPSLGPVDYIFADATRALPNAGTATFTPAIGGLADVRGAIAVDFGNRRADLQNLGFRIGSLTFSGLTGGSNFGTGAAAGTFAGNYATGTCSGCVGFNAPASVYVGNFIGTGASGLVFSTLLNTGAGNVAGVHVFKRP